MRWRIWKVGLGAGEVVVTPFVPLEEIESIEASLLSVLSESLADLKREEGMRGDWCLMCTTVCPRPSQTHVFSRSSRTLEEKRMGN